MVVGQSNRVLLPGAVVVQVYYVFRRGGRLPVGRLSFCSLPPWIAHTAMTSWIPLPILNPRPARSALGKIATACI